jgi:hypothetical protein
MILRLLSCVGMLASLLNLSFCAESGISIEVICRLNTHFVLTSFHAQDDAASIEFGLQKDAVLYRKHSAVLATDNAFEVNSNSFFVFCKHAGAERFLSPGRFKALIY